MANEANQRTERDLQLLVESLEADLARETREHNHTRRLYAMITNTFNACSVQLAEVRTERNRAEHRVVQLRELVREHLELVTSRAPDEARLSDVREMLVAFANEVT